MLLPRLFPHLGKRRQTQVQICLDALEDWKKWLAEGWFGLRPYPDIVEAKWLN